MSNNVFQSVIIQLKEATDRTFGVIDTDGSVYRPDRVVKDGGKVMIVDYKFGEHHRKYGRQMLRYADLWRRMGYSDVSAFLWYVHTGEVVEIL